MKIAIDLSPLQGPHRMRGIGYTVLQFINHIPNSERSEHQFVFYIDPTAESPLELLQLDGITYELRDLRPRTRINLKLPGKLRYVGRALNIFAELKEVYIGDSRVGSLKGIDVFLQCDQSQVLPRKRSGTRNALIVYDIIPYVLEWDYLWSYRTARRVHGFPVKAAVHCGVRRWLYLHKLKTNTKHAHRLLSISQATAEDFIQTVSVPRKKLAVTPLGVPELSSSAAESTSITLDHFQNSSWGYIGKKKKLTSDTPFLLFVGGADRRRKLEDLVTAFNRLRAEGVDIKLVLSGDSMQGPRNISTEETQHALANSSYLEDILFVGFTSDAHREWLYSHALAFVFPSVYEGFGLPVLEALQYGTPVISYKNAATQEVAGNNALYASNPQELKKQVLQLIDHPWSAAQKQKAKNQTAKFTWSKTSREILKNCQF